MTCRFLKISDPTFDTKSLSSMVEITRLTKAESKSWPAFDFTVS